MTGLWKTSRRSVLGMAGAGAAVLAGGAPARALGRPAEEIDALIAQGAASAPFPGLAIAVEQRGRIAYRKAFGFADVENRAPATPETVFPIGSITKSMTGLAMMQLVAKGAVGLDDPASRFLQDLPPAVGAIRVRNLLDHTSGLTSYTDVPSFPKDSQKPFTRDEVVRSFADLPLEFPVGSRWSYTNSGLYLAGLIIEKASGQTYDRYLRDNVFVPFGMTHTAIWSWRDVLDRRAYGYVSVGGALQNAPRYDPLVPFAAGAVMSTVDDMLRYRRGVFGDGPTSPEVRRLVLQRDRLTSGQQLPYSLGCLVDTDFEGHRKIGHSGDIFGFSAHYAYYPDDDVTIILLTNMQNGAFPPISLEQKVARVVLGLPQPNIVDRSIDAATARRFTGDYEVGDIRFGFDRLGFVADGGGLQVRFGGVESRGALLPLKWQGDDDFVSSFDDEQRFRFDLHAHPARVYMSYYGSTFEAAKVPAS